MSTTTPLAMPKAVPSTTLAVLRPTPGRLDQRVQIVRAPGRRTRRPAAAAGLECSWPCCEKSRCSGCACSNSAGGAAAKAAADGYLRNSAWRDQVHPHVGALGRKDRGDEQLQRSAESARRTRRRDRPFFSRRATAAAWRLASAVATMRSLRSWNEKISSRRARASAAGPRFAGGCRAAMCHRRDGIVLDGCQAVSSAGRTVTAAGETASRALAVVWAQSRPAVWPRTSARQAAV